MSRIGNRPVAIPAGVEVTVDANNVVRDLRANCRNR